MRDLRVRSIGQNLFSLLLLVFVVALPGLAAAQVHDYFVSTNGSDANDGLAATVGGGHGPWKTMLHADSAFTLGTATTSNCGSTYWAGEAGVATCIHVAAGTYGGGVLITTHQGTSGHRVVWISDTKRGAHLQNLVTTDAGVWVLNGGFISIVGFEVSAIGGNTPGAHAGLITTDSTGSTHYYYNYIHDLTQWDRNTNTDCGQGGGGGIESINLTPNVWVISNEIARVGVQGTGCNHNHGIYIYGQNDLIENNLIYNITCTGIVLTQPGGPNGAENGGVIANNTVFRVSGPAGGGAATCNGILVGNNSAVTIINNIIYNTGAAGDHCAIYAISGLSGALIANNLWKQDTNGVGGGGVSTCFISGALTNVTQSGNLNVGPQFVNFQGDGSGDYHLKDSSQAIWAGVSRSGLDLAGNPRHNPPSLGVYELVSSARSVGPPTGLTAVVH